MMTISEVRGVANGDLSESRRRSSVSLGCLHVTKDLEGPHRAEGAPVSLEQPAGRIGVAIACGGHHELAITCVESVRRNCDLSVPIHVAFDGNEPDYDVVKRLLDFGATYTVFDEPKGISAAWNCSIGACLDQNVNYVAVLNDDLEVHKDFDRLYLNFFSRHPEVRIACSFDRLTGWSIIPEVNKRFSKAWGHDRLPIGFHYTKPGGHYGPEGFDSFSTWVASLNHPEFLRGRMNGACFVMSRRCIEEDGLFDDEAFQPPGCCEDLDMWQRIAFRHGPDALGGVTKSFVHHLRAVTLSSYPREWANARIAENGARFRTKWPTEKWGDLETWFGKLNATPADKPEPPLPRPRWW